MALINLLAFGSILSIGLSSCPREACTLAVIPFRLRTDIVNPFEPCGKEYAGDVKTNLRNGMINLGFRSVTESILMSDDDVRNTVIVELSLICNEAIPVIQAYTDYELLGKIYNAHILETNLGARTNAELGVMSTDDERNTIIVEINKRSGYELSITHLQAQSDILLSCLAISPFYVRLNDNNLFCSIGVYDSSSDYLKWEFEDGCMEAIYDYGDDSCHYTSFYSATNAAHWFRHQYLDIKVSEYSSGMLRDASWSLKDPKNGSNDTDCHSFETTIDDGAGGRTGAYYLIQQNGDIFIKNNIIAAEYNDATFCIEWI